MSTITVRVGREEKEISGLTRKTTCSEVLQALLKDKQTEWNAARQNAEASTTDELEFNFSANKSLKEIAQGFVIVENWRGCEKPLPPRTRIFAVWQAWGKEQCHVKFSLKKSKCTRYRDAHHHHHSTRAEGSPSRCNNLINNLPQRHTGAESAHFLDNLSQGRKRRIRRSMMQFQRAVMTQQTKDGGEDKNNNKSISAHAPTIGSKVATSAGDRCVAVRQKTTETTEVTITLSEEQFVDGVITGPDCLLRHTDKSKFIQSALDNRDFNREHCTYRRRNHRRRSLMQDDDDDDDSDALSDQNVQLSGSRRDRNVGHYPYCQNSRRRSRSSSQRKRRHRRDSRHRHGRVGKSRRSRRHAYRYSTDDTTTTTSTGTTSTGSDAEIDSHSAGEDADDEKSIMAEFGSAVSRQKAVSFATAMLQCTDSYSSGTTTTTTATDSSSGTTTCSETSNTSGSSISGTSSSETSSGTDYLESYLRAKRASPAVAVAPATSSKPEKQKNSGAAKLFRKVTGPGLTKPAQSLIGTFRKKRRAPQPPVAKASSSAGKSPAPSQPSSGKGSKRSVTFAAVPNSRKEQSAKPAPSEESLKTTLPADTDTGVTKPENKALSAAEKNKSTDSEETVAKELEELKQLIITQERVLLDQKKKVTTADADIERIEADVHRYRIRAHGKNYVQDTYLSGMGDTTDPNSREGGELGVPSNRVSSLRPPQWVSDTRDTKALAMYVAACEKVVEMQLKIEEYKRKSEIVLQEMQDEVWRASSNPTGEQKNPLTAAASALGLVSTKNAGDSSDEESDTRLASLSVSSGKGKSLPQKEVPVVSQPAQKDGLSTAESTLELEKSRTELEANLYLSLRLSSELEEMEHRALISQRHIQAKGEALLNLVRELAASPEGISPELWEEYGELLTAYDNEISLQRYLAACAQADPNSPAFAPENGVHTPQENDPLSPATSALHHALSPWLWCEHCKMELQQQQNGLQTPPISPHWFSHGDVPANFSELPLPSPAPVPAAAAPLPSPSRSTASVTALLPMPPIPDYRSDCEYEELSDAADNNNATSTIISTEDAIPRGIILRHPATRRPSPQTRVIEAPFTAELKDYLSVTRNNNANNTDDSGNASAGSTSSFASSDSTDMGSRNSSCDGGSPRPLPSVGTESQDSATSSPAFFSRGNVKRGSCRNRFVFPPQLKVTQDDHLKASSRMSPRSPSRANVPKNRPSFASKPALALIPGTIASAPVSPADLRIISMNKDEQDRLAQQQKLIRRNSGQRRKPNPVLLEKQQNEQFGKRGGSFGKGALPSHLSGILKKPIVYNSHCDVRQSEPLKRVALHNGGEIKGKGGKHCPSPLNLLSAAGVGPAHHRSPASAPCSPFVTGNPRNLTRGQRRPNIQSVTGGVRKVEAPCDNDSDTGLSSLHSTDSDLIMYSETLV
nr:uncharacterized protein LOC100177998 [Ciona intestinalis]|eukprot:XP_009862277.1 uncharacterized protein LOC100177998 [Ciona intestinalis]